MRLLKWENLPIDMQTEEVRKYYDILKKKKCALFFKRAFDIFVSLFMLIILSPLFLILAIMIKIDSKGPVFYRAKRLGQNGKTFEVLKFRTMYLGADKKLSTILEENPKMKQEYAFRHLLIEMANHLPRSPAPAEMGRNLCL